MYKSNLAVAVKVNGQVLREFGDSVKIPFGSEYSLFVKNMEAVRAVVNITIDGQQVVKGGLVVLPGESVDLERWVKTDLAHGNRFKFIARTDSIEQHRGIGAEDGLIRFEWQFEQKLDCSVRDLPWVASGAPQSPNFDMGILTCTSGIHPTYDGAQLQASGLNAQQPGITVPGSHSDQRFQESSWFPVRAERHALVLRLLGFDGQEPVVNPVTVKMKPRCVTCGRNNRATSKFCTECGTALEIHA